MPSLPRLLGAFVALSLSSPAFSATVAGTVRTADGRPLPQVVLKISSSSASHDVVTGPAGRFRLDGLPAGEYRVALDVPGLALAGEPRLAARDEAEATVEVVVEPARVREQVVVSATRNEAVASALGVTVTALDEREIAGREPASFVHLLQTVPGVAVARTGGPGQLAAAFVRGGSSRATRVLIDGIPANEPGGAFDYAALVPLELERVEVVRGATSSLYGTDALGGVLQLVTRQAAPGERPNLRAELEGGSFVWRRARGGTAGRHGRAHWNGGVEWLQADNEQPNSRFEGWAGALSAGTELGPRTELQLALRADDSTTGTPGQVAFGRPDLDARFERDGWTAALRLRHAGERLVHTAQLGRASRDQLTLNPEDSGSFLPTYRGRTSTFGTFFDFVDPDGFQNDSDRSSASYQLEAAVHAEHLLVAGVELERETGVIGTRRSPAEQIDAERSNGGVFVQDRWSRGGRFFATLGARLEHNDSFGDSLVPRLALAWRARTGTSATTVKLSGGLGVKEPTFSESFGVSDFAKGNPDLEAEKSRTADLGLEQWLAGGRVRLEATGFWHDYRNEIGFQILDFTTFHGTFTNIGHTEARGLELAADAAPRPWLRLGARYTFTRGEILASTSDFDPVYEVGSSLLRRPEHQGSLSVDLTRGRVSAGADLVSVGTRRDSDFAGLGLLEAEAYTRIDARAAVEVARGFRVFVAAENLADADYMEVLGYPALGRSVRAGVRWQSGRAR